MTDYWAFVAVVNVVVLKGRLTARVMRTAM